MVPIIDPAAFMEDLLAEPEFWRELEKHGGDLAGKPEIVFRVEQVAVFLDGDFWHGWRFPSWKDTLSPKWQAKIVGNRKRDRRNHQSLRRKGWTVIRIWEHQVKQSLDDCIRRI